MFYRIVLQGHVAQGANVSDVKQQFARVTGLPPSVTERLFGSTPNVIKRQVPQADAERIVTTLRAIGATVTLEPDFQGPSAGGLDPVTVPAIPSYRHIDLPPEPVPASAAPAASRSAWTRRMWKLHEMALPAGAAAVLVAAAVYFEPEIEELARGFRKPPTAVAVPATRKPAADTAAAPEIRVVNASLLHGPWRCTNQNDGSSTYWHYRPDGSLAYLGDDLRHGDQPIVGPDIPASWALDGNRLRLGAEPGSARQVTLDRLSLTQLDYYDAKGNATHCSRP